MSRNLQEKRPYFDFDLDEDLDDLPPRPPTPGAVSTAHRCYSNVVPLPHSGPRLSLAEGWARGAAHRAGVQRTERSDLAAAAAFEDDIFSAHLGGGAADVQLKAKDVNAEDTDVQAIAAAGIQGGGQPLPHLERIQAAFGDHDVSHIRAHIGGSAADAANAIGAEAYATGSHVAFESSPDLHTAAHEAAHVIQQQQGVQLKGGVGRAGDQYEQHADAVADRVVRGESAAALLGSIGSLASPSLAPVQRKSHKHARPKAGRRSEHPLDEDVAIGVINAADMILESRFMGVEYNLDYVIGQTPERFHKALEALRYATHSGVRTTKRLTWLDSAEQQLDPIAHQVAPLLDDESWVDDNYRKKIQQLRSDLLYDTQYERVQSAFMTDDGQVLEVSEAADTEEQVRSARHAVHCLIESAGRLNEQVIRMNEPEIEKAAEELSKGKLPPGVKSGPGALTQLQAVLGLGDGWLTLTDEELPRHLVEIHRFWPYVRTRAELVKGVIEIIGGSIATISGFTWAIAKSVGDTKAAAVASGLAKSSVLNLGTAVAFAELVYDVTVAFDGSAAQGAREDAVANMASTTTWLGGRMIANGMATEAAKDAAMGTVAAATIALIVSYEELKFVANLYGQARVGLANGLRHGLSFLDMCASHVAKESQLLAISGILHAREKDSAKRVLLDHIRQLHERQLAKAIDDFLGDCSPGGQGNGQVEDPGAWSALVAEFAEFQVFRGATTPKNVTTVAKRILARMTWCKKHADYLVAKTAGMKTEHPSYTESAAKGEKKDQ